MFSGLERAILLSGFRLKHTLVISQDVREEALAVLGRKFPRLRQEAEEALSLLRLEVVPRNAYEGALNDFPDLRDPKDAHVLAAAFASGCDAVVTGDRDLLELQEVKGVRILRPAELRRTAGD